jgi:hypothetical protein
MNNRPSTRTKYRETCFRLKFNFQKNTLYVTNVTVQGGHNVSIKRAASRAKGIS